MFVQGEKNKKKERVFSEGSLHVQCSIFKRAFSGVAFRPSNLGLFGSSLQPGARGKKKRKKEKIAPIEKKRTPERLFLRIKRNLFFCGLFFASRNGDGW